MDLSKPNELWFTLETLLKSLRARVDSVINEARLKEAEIKEEFKTKAKERYDENHPDVNMVDPFPIPLVIIGTKYDIFQDVSSPTIWGVDFIYSPR